MATIAKKTAKKAKSRNVAQFREPNPEFLESAVFRFRQHANQIES